MQRWACRSFLQPVVDRIQQDLPFPNPIYERQATCQSNRRTQDWVQDLCRELSHVSHLLDCLTKWKSCTCSSSHQPLQISPFTFLDVIKTQNIFSIPVFLFWPFLFGGISLNSRILHSPQSCIFQEINNSLKEKKTTQHNFPSRRESAPGLPQHMLTTPPHALSVLLHQHPSRFSKNFPSEG